AANYVPDARAGDRIIIDRPVGCADLDRGGIAVAEIEARAPSVIEEQPVARPAVTDPDVERDRLVDRVGRRGECIGIGVPVDEGAAAPVERAGLVPEPVDMLADRERLAQRETAAVETQRTRRIG